MGEWVWISPNYPKPSSLITIVTANYKFTIIIIGILESILTNISNKSNFISFQIQGSSITSPMSQNILCLLTPLHHSCILLHLFKSLYFWKVRSISLWNYPISNSNQIKWAKDSWVFWIFSCEEPCFLWFPTKYIKKTKQITLLSISHCVLKAIQFDWAPPEWNF